MRGDRPGGAGRRLTIARGPAPPRGGRAADLSGKLDRAGPQPRGIRIETQDQLGLARGDLL